MMIQEPDIATIATLIGEPARAIMLSALLGGEALPASELASRAHITPQTASSHLSKLLEGKLVSVTVRGRHRYYALRSRAVAQTLEALQVIAPPAKNIPNRKPKIEPALCHARTCYDHLAGKLGVTLSHELIEQGYLIEANQGYELTDRGTHLAESWNINVDSLRKKRRKFAYDCLDWSERRFHLAGSLGAAIADTFFNNGWVKRLPDTRALKVTSDGAEMLEREFRIVFVPLQTGADTFLVPPPNLL